MHGPRELGRPRPFLPPFLIPTSWPVASAGNRTFHPGSPHPWFALLSSSPRIRPNGLAHSPKRQAKRRPGTERSFVRIEARPAFAQKTPVRPSPSRLRPVAQSFSPRVAQAPSPKPGAERGCFLARKQVGQRGSRELSFAHRLAHLPLPLNSISWTLEAVTKQRTKSQKLNSKSQVPTH
jgi:hypothetical protein